MLTAEYVLLTAILIQLSLQTNSLASESKQQNVQAFLWEVLSVLLLETP